MSRYNPVVDMDRVRVPKTWDEYQRLENEMYSMTKSELWHLHWVLARKDLFFLLWKVLSTSHFFRNESIIKPWWIMERCKEVDAESDRCLDVWSRFHWKSIIKSFAQPIKETLNDSAVTQVIFSHTRPLAKQFAAQIQREISGNDLLKSISWDPLLDDQIFPDNPNHLERNSLDEGIIVNRIENPKEGTFEAYGLVDSLPTSKHFIRRILDDAVTKDSVNTIEQKRRVLQAWELSQPLGMPDGRSEETAHGTFYSYDDLYHTMVKRGYKLRLHPCYDIDWDKSKIDEEGNILRLAHDMESPSLYKKSKIAGFFQSMGAEEGSSTAAMQLLCDPSAGTAMGFDGEHLNTYKARGLAERKAMADGKVLYMLVDPANETGKGHDYTSIWIVALGEDRCAYAVDMVRDKLSLTDRAEKVFELHREWKPHQVRYERYGMVIDVQHLRYKQQQEGYRFKITEVPPKGSSRSVNKEDRINRLLPLFEGGRFYLPEVLFYRNAAGKKLDLVKIFINDEYLTFPNSRNDDMLDALSRLMEPDLKLRWPGDPYAEVATSRPEGELTYSTDRYRPGTLEVQGEDSWMVP